MSDNPSTIRDASFDLMLKSGGIDDALDVLEKAIRGPRASHKYSRRWRNAKGEWEYEYATPVEKQHAQMAFTFAAAHGTETQQERALDVLKRVEPDKWQDHVHAANAAAHAAAARPLPAHDPLPHQPVVAVMPEVARFAHGEPKPEVAAARRIEAARSQMVAAGFPVRADPLGKTDSADVGDRASRLRSYASTFYNDSIHMGIVNDEPKVVAKFTADEHLRQAARLRVLEDDFREMSARAMTMRLRLPAGWSLADVDRTRDMLEREYREMDKLAARHEAAAASSKPAAPAAEPFLTKRVDGFRDIRVFVDGSGADGTAFIPVGRGNVRVEFILDTLGKVRASHATLPYMDRFASRRFESAIKSLGAKFEAALDPTWRAQHAQRYGYTAPAMPLVVAPVDTAKPYVPSAEEDAAFKEADRQRTAGASTGEKEPGAVNFETMPDTPSKPKKRASKARHGVEVQAAWEAAGSPKLEGADREAALERMGEYLHEIQDFRAGQDDTGMSGADMTVWKRATSPARMASILRKYRRQLTAGHGDLYFRAGLHEPEPIPKGHLPAQGKWTERGGLVLKVDGYLGSKFGPWKTLLKQHGFQWNGERGVNSADGMHAAQASKLDIPAFVEAADKLGIFVDIPEKPEIVNTVAAQEMVREAGPPADRAVTTDDVMTAIDDVRARRARNAVALTLKPDGQYAFYAADYRKKTEPGSFWHTMSSQNGVISGLMDVDATDWSVNTYSPELAMEALGKLKAANPTFHFYVDPRVEKAVADAAVAKAEAQKPIPEVEALLADGFALKPYQNEMVRFLDKANGNAIVGDEMGLGKTLQSLAWVAKNDKKAIVVVPKVVRRTWIEEAHKFFPGHFNAKELRSKDLLAKKSKKKADPNAPPPSVLEILQSAKDQKSPMDLTGKNLVTVNYESLEKFLPYLKAAGFDTIIVDESHRAKNPKAKTTKTIQAIAKTMKHRILMSGTAVKNGKEELFTQLEMVKPGIWPSAKALQSSTHGKAWNKMRDVYLARSKKNVLKDLPEKTTTITKLYVPGAPDIGDLKPPKEPPANATTAQRAAYEDAYERWIDNAAAVDFEERAYGDDDDGSGSLSIGEFSRVRGQLALAKVDSTADMVKEILGSSDSKVLVFTESVAAAKAIAEKFGDEALLHYGQQSDDKREAAKREFQRDGSPKRVFVSTRPSLAVGATLTAADKVVFNDLPWTAADVRQAEDRTHRVGQKNAVNVYWNVAEDNEFDENVAAILRRKYDLSAKINEGRQLSPEEKAWMDKPVTISDIMDRIRGKTVGPAEKVEKSAKAQLRDMTRALLKSAR